MVGIDSSIPVRHHKGRVLMKVDTIEFSEVWDVLGLDLPLHPPKFKKRQLRYRK